MLQERIVVREVHADLRDDQHLRKIVVLLAQHEIVFLLLADILPSLKATHQHFLNISLVRLLFSGIELSLILVHLLDDFASHQLVDQFILSLHFILYIHSKPYPLIFKYPGCSFTSPKP